LPIKVKWIQGLQVDSPVNRIVDASEPPNVGLVASLNDNNADLLNGS
jgi:hypothetical protein